MIFDSVRFGEIEVDDDSCIEFIGPILGFEHHQKFVLLDEPEVRPLQWLQSADDPTLCLPVIEPYLLVPEYDIEVPDHEVEALELARAEDACILCIVVLAKDSDEVRMNLCAPIVINLCSRTAKQVVLSGSEQPIQFRFRDETAAMDMVGKEAVGASA